MSGVVRTLAEDTKLEENFCCGIGRIHFRVIGWYKPTRCQWHKIVMTKDVGRKWLDVIWRQKTRGTFLFCCKWHACSRRFCDTKFRRYQRRKIPTAKIVLLDIGDYRKLVKDKKIKKIFRFLVLGWIFKMVLWYQIHKIPIPQNRNGERSRVNVFGDDQTLIEGRKHVKSLCCGVRRFPYEINY